MKVHLYSFLMDSSQEFERKPGRMLPFKSNPTAEHIFNLPPHYLLPAISRDMNARCSSTRYIHPTRLTSLPRLNSMVVISAGIMMTPVHDRDSRCGSFHLRDADSVCSWEKSLKTPLTAGVWISP